MFSAIQAWERIWNQIDLEIIANCWCHTEILETGGTSLSASVQEDESQLHNVIQSLVPSHTKTNINNLFSPVRENYCITDASDAQIVDEITGSCEQNDSFIDGGCDVEALLPPIQALLQAVFFCKRLYDAFNVNDTIRGALSILQRKVQLQCLSTMRQTTLDGWFN